MRVKVGNQKAARHTIGDDECEKCVFYLESLWLCRSMKCGTHGVFCQSGTLEDIFKL